MSVINESPSARRRETHSETPSRVNAWRYTAALHSPPTHTIVITLQLHAVPVHGGRLMQLIHHCDLHRPIALQDQRRTRGARILWNQFVRLLNLVAESCRQTVAGRPLTHKQPKFPAAA